MTHPPDVAGDRPLRPWLATVLRNRWRMDRRGRARRVAREQALGLELADAQGADAADAADAPAAIDRARMLERLASALVALDEPFRTVVVRRYLDGESAAEIARALGDAAPRDATIRGKTVDTSGVPVPDVRVTAVPEEPAGSSGPPRAVAFATSGPDGTFVLENLDR